MKIKHTKHVLPLVLALLFALPPTGRSAITPLPQRGQGWYMPNGYVPNAAADIVASDVFVDQIILANVTGGAVTVTIKDKTTACNSAACQWWPTISIAANTTYTVDVGGILSTGGVNWVASASNSVVGFMRGAYTQ